MVNADDPKIKENRLHLLVSLHDLIGKQQIYLFFTN